jgi:SAM-dependent MidA family methyltransferase
LDQVFQRLQRPALLQPPARLQARRLIMPGDMGESFKAMAWLRGLELPLSAFAPQDLRHKS